ncbi:AAA family ATPase [Lysinibacillus capsici]|uniref:AAA family ATPase n=1 Tax=Lysinibacillus capsici TaxID=2115968 RepID=UPI0028BDD818|nr:AAA family ATPase [Lysinibacillus capsici]WNN77031.1 AAA family ATPase [Lysinibacillus capsici]
MKILKMIVKGHPLFKDDLELNFVASQKITEENKKGLYPIFSSIFKQDVIGIIGINASGKTTTLKILSCVLDIYLKNGQINSEKYKSLLGNNRIEIQAFFSDEKRQIYKICSILDIDNEKNRVFTEEFLWIKKLVSSTNKKNLFEFEDKHLQIIRSKENSPYLTNFMSIMISQFKKQKNTPMMIDLLDNTNMNIVRVNGKVPMEVVKYLDNSIEYFITELESDDKIIIRLKFVNQENEIILNNIMHLQSYLSSGTMKGLNVFAGIQNVLLTGGYLIVDEIENHFNKEIVRAIIQFFKDKKINKLGATLVFTTHYSELLDEFERNDSIYIAFKDSTLKIESLNNLLVRSDYKKSEIYQSSFLGNTAPSYENFMALKKYFLNESENLKRYNE